MRTEDFVLLGAFAAVIIFGYYIMLRLDHFLDKIRRKNEEQEPTSCLHIATSCFNAIPAVSNVLKDIKDLYPNVRCSLSVGHEREVIYSFDSGDTDVAIISADSEIKSGTAAECRRIRLDPQSFSIDNGIVEVNSVEKKAQHQKVLWKSSNNQSLVLSFIHHFCGQRP